MENGSNLPTGSPSQNVPGLFSSDPAAIAAAEQARAQIQTAFLVAMQKPRDEATARDKIIEACRRPKFARTVEYCKPIGGGKTATGPSVRFAEEMIRAWRNVLTPTQVIYEDDDIMRVRVTCIDLESNVQYSKEMQIKKTVERRSNKDREVVGQRVNSYGDTVYIVKATEDDLHNKVASAISKAVRNEGLRLIPADIIDDAIAAARYTMNKEDAEDPKSQIKTLCDWFSGQGVKPKNLSEFLGHSLDEQITTAELQELRGIYQALAAGETTWRDVMETKHGDTKKTNGSGTDALCDRLGVAASSETDDAPADGAEDETPICVDCGRPIDPLVGCDVCNAAKGGA